MTALMPMLCRRQDLTDEMFGAARFAVQPKLDGERVIAHLSKADKKLFMHSRRQNEFVNYQNNMLDDMMKAIAGQSTKVILDGEIMTFDTSEHAYVSFGQNRVRSSCVPAAPCELPVFCRRVASHLCALFITASRSVPRAACARRNCGTDDR